jgi:hypothetical protein
MWGEGNPAGDLFATSWLTPFSRNTDRREGFRNLTLGNVDPQAVCDLVRDEPDTLVLTPLEDAASRLPCPGAPVVVIRP